MTSNLEAPTTVNVPSADLINYRFDELSGQYKDLNRDMNLKLDAILTQQASYVTEVRVEKMITEALSPLKETLITYRWYLRTIVGAFIVALAYWIIATLAHKG